MAGNDPVRIDAWLWAARFFKTRALAKQAIERGRVTIAGAACKPSHTVKVGEALRVTHGDETFEITAGAQLPDPAAFVQRMNRALLGAWSPSGAESQFR